VPYQTLREGAIKLTEYHREAEPGLRRVAFYPDPRGKEIRLLEIVAGSPTSNEVLPFRFAPDPDREIYFPSVIVELSPQEYLMLSQGRLTLPEEWKLSQPEELWSDAGLAAQ
jgi:hypothetical protein